MFNTGFTPMDDNDRYDDDQMLCGEYQTKQKNDDEQWWDLFKQPFWQQQKIFEPNKAIWLY